MAKPFLKWAGGKSRLLPTLRTHIPAEWIANDMLGYGRFIEPFMGSGAFFFDLCPTHARLSDCNDRLIRTYRAVRDNVEEVIALLQMQAEAGRVLGTEQVYYAMRNAPAIDEASDVAVAVWLIYLNRTGYNGLYRVNRSGGYNVPFGKRDFSFDPNALRKASNALQGAWLYTHDFEDMIDGAVAGDLVYADPPYVGTFAGYGAGGFTGTDQARLRDALLRAKARGVYVIASNSIAAAPLYEDGFNVHLVYAERRIAANGDRRPAREIICT